MNVHITLYGVNIHVYAMRTYKYNSVGSLIIHENFFLNMSVIVIVASRKTKSKPDRKPQRQFLYRSNLKQTFELVKDCNLNEQHKSLLSKTPFAKLFETFYTKQLTLENIQKNDALIERIILSYHPSKTTFRLGDKLVKLKPLDIQLIFGLTSGEEPIVQSRYTRSDSSFLSRLTYQPREFSVAFLKSLVEKKVDKTSEDEVHDVVRLLCLHLLTTCFFSTTGQQVPKWLVRYIEDVEEMSKYNWSEAIYTEFETSLKKSYTEPRSVTGCVVALQYWLCEHTTLVNPIQGKEFSIPRMQRWCLTTYSSTIDGTPISNLLDDQVKENDIEESLNEIQLGIVSKHDSDDDTIVRDTLAEEENELDKGKKPITEDEPELDYMIGKIIDDYMAHFFSRPSIRLDAPMFDIGINPPKDNITSTSSTQHIAFGDVYRQLDQIQKDFGNKQMGEHATIVAYRKIVAILTVKNITQKTETDDLNAAFMRQKEDYERTAADLTSKVSKLEGEKVTLLTKMGVYDVTQKHRDPLVDPEKEDLKKRCKDLEVELEKAKQINKMLKTEKKAGTKAYASKFKEINQAIKDLEAKLRPYATPKTSTCHTTAAPSPPSCTDLQMTEAVSISFVLPTATDTGHDHHTTQLSAEEPQQETPKVSSIVNKVKIKVRQPCKKDSDFVYPKSKGKGKEKENLVTIDLDETPINEYEDNIKMPPWKKSKLAVMIDNQDWYKHSTKDLNSKGRKRMKVSEGKECASTCYARFSYGYEQKKVIHQSDPFQIPDLLHALDSGKYGSVTKDIQDLVARRMEILKPLYAMHPELPFTCLDMKENSNVEALTVNQPATPLKNDVVDLEDDNAGKNALAIKPIVIIDSDDDEPGERRPTFPLQDVGLKNSGGMLLMKDFLNNTLPPSSNYTRPPNRALKKEHAMLADETVKVKQEQVMDVGEEAENDAQIEEEDEQPDINDGLADIWKEMTVAMECSKEIPVEPTFDDHDVAGGGEECDHSFLLKDDIGYVCRICGVIQRGIETIIEYQHPKATRNTRTYWNEGRSSKDREADELLNGFKLSSQDFIISEISAHPRHRKQMKPHQIEGFNFLLSNLVTENPGGCIMAHAPGSGKTFMIISFLQSFMAKYPFARPLVVLPRGILGTWKREFKLWQVEDFPLYDFYSVKAEGRAQQLEVLKQWAEERSVLFLGYKQFSTIVCDTDNGKAAAACQEILLTCPSILILDEGHTPRNQDTDVLTSLEKVQTPRKVVLSGTLYQNHVKEVFNILNLVRPKFLRLENSKLIKKRILSRVPISKKKDVLKKGSDNDFYELVEHTLLRDDNFKRKETVIKDLREMTSKVLHYYKGDFLDELPGLIDFTIFLELSPTQKREVKDLKKLGRKFKISSDGSAIYVYPQLKALAKNSTSKERVDENKIDELLENFDEREGVKARFYLNLLNLCESAGEKLLVFSQYLLPLKFLERLTVKAKGWCQGKEIFMITGDSDNELRETSMERFNNLPDARVFFGSIKACGEGISLVGASRIIILDVHLNPSVTRQAIGRAYRPGQTKKVYIYRLVADGSPEAEDHTSCFRKESIAKMWFEWNEFCGTQDFEMETVDINRCDDMFLETPRLNKDVVALFKR